MRAVVYPSHSYISDNLIRHLQKSGHEVVPWDGPETAVAWQAALQHATTVFHVLHGHEVHAKETLLKLLQSTNNGSTITFVGISTPLTWAATPAPAAAASAVAAEATHAVQALPDHAAATAIAGLQPAQDAATADSPGLSQYSQIPCLRDEDAPKRRPAAAAVETFHSEQLVLRCNRPGRLHTHVVCPGILYGAGESDDQLHLLWKAAWEGWQPLQVHGTGHNRLPTLHVADLAAFCEGVALQEPREQQGHQQQLQGRPPAQQQQQQGKYWVAVDAAHVTQRQLVDGIGQLLVHTDIRSASTSLLVPPVSPLLLLYLPLACSTLQQQPRDRMCPHGLLTHLPQVLQELVAARTLSPLRILIRGPPAGGKTHLGLRLAQAYGLLYINASTILAELQHMDPDTQKAVNAQLSGREGRVSHQLMAKLAQHLLARHPLAVKQGWVMDGWPRSLNAACLMTSVGAANSSGSSSGMSSSSGGGTEGGGKGSRRDSMASAGIKDKRRLTGNVTGGVTAGSTPGAKGRRSNGEDDAVLGGHEGLSLQSPELLPHVLIELDVAEEELQRRVKALADAAAALAAVDAAAGKGATTTSSGSSSKKAAAAAGSRPSIAGGTSQQQQQQQPLAGSAAAAAAGPFVAVHNNLKDWGRRMEAYKALLHEDAADLTAKRAAVITSYQAQLAAEAQGGDKAVPAANKGSSGRQPGDRAAAGGGGAGAGGSRMATPCHAHRSSVGGVDLQLPPDVKLPEHGGFVAYFVDAGAKYIRASNPCDATAAAAATAAATAAAAAGPPSPRMSRAASRAISRGSSRAATPRAAAAAAAQPQGQALLRPHSPRNTGSHACDASGPPPLPPLVSLEQQLAAEIGPPHNYKGFPQGYPQGAAAAANSTAAGAGPGSSEPEAASEQNLPGSAAATAAGAGIGAVGGKAAGASASALHRVNTAAASVSGRSVMESLMPDMAELKEAAEALAAEAAARDALSLSAAARPLAASLMESLMADLMEGLVEVALTRPTDPCQVIANHLSAAAARVKGSYQDPYEDPVYAIQQAKVEAKAAREAARAAAAAAKAEREAAAKGGVVASLDDKAAAAAAAASTDGSDRTKDKALAEECGTKPGVEPSRPVSSGPGGQKPGSRAAGSRASVAHGAAQAAR